MKSSAGTLGAAPTIPAGTPNMLNNVTGSLRSKVPGRTDALPVSVPEGAYIIPADVVSSVGHGNSEAGFTILEKRFPPGGPGQGKPTDIQAAGGEFVVSPQNVMALGRGNIHFGHEILDEYVKQERADFINRLKKIPNPKPDPKAK